MSLVKIFVYLNDSNHITINNTHMSKNIISFDIEYNSARKELTQIAYWNNCDPEPNFYKGYQVKDGLNKFKEALKKAYVLVGHNIKGWDLQILNFEISPDVFVWDTLEVEQLLNMVRGSYSLVTCHSADADARKAYELFRDQVNRMSEDDGLRARFLSNFNLKEQFLDELGEYKQEGTGIFMKGISCDEDLAEQINNHITDNPGKKKRLICPRTFWKELTLCRNDIVFGYYSQSNDNADYLYKEIDPDKLKSSESFSVEEKTRMEYFLEDCASSNCAPILANLPYAFLKKQIIEGRGRLLSITRNSGDSDIVCVDPNDVENDAGDNYADIKLFEEYNPLFSQNEGTIKETDVAVTIKTKFNCIKGVGGLVDDIIRFLKKNKKPIVAVYENMPDLEEIQNALNDRGIYVPQHNRKLSLVKCIDLICRNHSDSCGSIVFIKDEDLLHLCRTKFPEGISFLFLSWHVFGCKIALYKNNNLELVLRLHKKVLETISSNSTITQFYSDYPFDIELNQMVGDTDPAEFIREKFLGPNGSWYTEENGGYDQEAYLNNILKSSDGVVTNYFITIPTGGGKSVLFQGPAIYKFAKEHKLSIVITPLKQLMQDQYEGLSSKGFSKYVGYINSDLNINEKRNIINRIKEGEMGLLYIAPEQIVSGQLFDVLKNRSERDAGFGYIIFDEAHCISLWGGDFRARYKLGTVKIMNYIKNSCPSLFFSATLPELTKKDIRDLVNIEISDIKDGVQSIKKMPLDIRTYKNVDDNKQFIKKDNLTPILSESVLKYLHDIKDGFNEKESRVLIFYDDKSGDEKLTKNLNDNLPQESPFKGRIGYFHADLDADKKNEVVDKFRNGELLVVITTKAFGMGIDLPNIHYVLHVKIPGTIEDYIQEIGRAGRNQSSLKKAGLDNAQICCLLRTNQKTEKEYNPIKDRIILALTLLQKKFRDIRDGNIEHYFELPAFYKKGKQVSDYESSSIGDQIICELQALGRIEFIKDAKSVIFIKINQDNVLTDDTDQDEDCEKVMGALKANGVGENIEELGYEALLPSVDSEQGRLEKALSKLSVGKAITLDKELIFSWKDVKKEVKYCINNGLKQVRIEVFKSTIKEILSRKTATENEITKNEIVGITRDCLSSVLETIGDSEDKMPWGCGKVGEYTQNISNVVSKYMIQKKWLENIAANINDNEKRFRIVNYSNDSENVVESLVCSCNRLMAGLFSEKTVENTLYQSESINADTRLSIRLSKIDDISFADFLQAKRLLTSLGYISEHSNTASLVKVINTLPLTEEEKDIYKNREAVLDNKDGLLEKMFRIKYNKNDNYKIFQKLEEYMNIKNDEELQNFINDVNEDNPEELNKT